MPTLRQRAVSSVLRNYPFYSGCGRIANHSWVKALAGTSEEETWARVPGGEVLAPLDDLMGRSAYYAGEHDRKITWICQKLIRRGDTVLDIGANLGMVTVHLAHLVGDGGVVHAFEPNPRLIGFLQRALERNCLPQVKLHEFGLGPAESTLELRIPRSDTGEGSFVLNSDTENCLSVKVRVRTLDDVASEQDIRRVSLLKIDVEGFEASVFGGATRFLAQVPPDAILFEMMESIPGRASDSPVFRILLDCGYTFLSIPRSMLKMRLLPFNPFADAVPAFCHDFLAVRKDASDRISSVLQTSIVRRA
jgi:FkbM family methyltransferase